MNKVKVNKKGYSVYLMILGVVLMTLGIFRNEIVMVLQKSTKICLECIGIG